MTLASRIALTIITAGPFLAAAPAALAQQHTQWGKPSPTPVSPQELPEPDLDAWGQAYRAWGQPRILVLAGWSTADHTADSPADLLYNTDDSGMSQQLKAAFEMTINAPQADVFLVEANQLTAAATRLRSALQANNERAAVAMLARELNAELVIALRLLDYNEDADAPGRVIAQAIDAASARALWTLPFQWKGDGSARNIRVYGEQLAARFIDTYAKRTIHTQRYTVRLLGPSDDPATLRAVRDHLADIPGVSNIIERATAVSAAGDDQPPHSAMSVEVQFAGGFLDLQAEIADRLYDFDGGGARIIDAAGTSINLRVVRGAGRPSPAAERDDPALIPLGDGLIEVVIEGLTDADQLEEFTRAVRTRRDLGSPLSIEELTAFSAGPGPGSQGSARLTLACDAPFERILTEIRAIEGELPYTLEVAHLDRTTIVLHARQR